MNIFFTFLGIFFTFFVVAYLVASKAKQIDFEKNPEDYLNDDEN